VPICAFTGNDEPFIKAHIVPRSFYQLDQKEPHKIVTLGGHAPPKRSPVGLYDGELVGDTAERYFSELDDYAFKALVSEFKPDTLVVDGMPAIDPSGRMIAGFLPGIATEKIARFILSVLWRASASKREETRSCALGPFQDEIRSILRDTSRICTDFFDVILMHDDSGVISKAVLFPTQMRFEGVNWQHGIIGRWSFYCRTDKRRGPPGLVDVALRKDRVLHFMSSDFRESAMAKSMVKGFSKSITRYGATFGKSDKRPAAS
jgi:hypothetical protein